MAMLALEESVARHYRHGRLEDAIFSGISGSGRSPSSISQEELAAVDEFHMGGRQVTAEIAARLDLGPDSHVLDIGCGIGGTARFLAHRYGCRVTGIDVTDEYVAVANRLTALVGLADLVRHEVGSATRMPIANDSIDAALLLHVGMNIPDKTTLCGEVARVLKRGGAFVVYDVMCVGEGEITYPVAWATTPETSFLARPRQYREALAQAGFEIVDERDRTAFAVELFRRAQTRLAEKGPPPLGLHLLMGEDAASKAANMLSNLEAGRIAPMEMLCRRL